MKTATLWFALVLGAAGLAGAQDLAPSSIPDAIKAPATDKLAMTVTARGVQIYECRPTKEDAAKFEWVFKSPEAELFDAGGKKVGKHYAGPTWESNDGSKVVGEVKAKMDSPDGSIPWLMLVAKKNEGPGVLGKVTSIQRILTEGGKAPSESPEAAQAGTELRVTYNATYLFYVKKD